MSSTLFKWMFRANLKTVFNYTIGMVLYMWLIIYVYPAVSSSSALNNYVQSLPSPMQRAVGMEGGIHQLGDILAGDYYGLIYLIILAIFTIGTATKLMANMVDRGSMACLLSTPKSRAQIALTQAAVLVSGLFTICLVTTFGGLAGSVWFIKDTSLISASFLSVNWIGFLLFAVIGSYCFFFSCLFNNEKRAIGVSAGVTFVFFALNMAGKLSNNLAWMKNISLFTAFDTQSIFHGDVSIVRLSIGLAAAALIIFICAILVFRERDLPL